LHCGDVGWKHQCEERQGKRMSSKSVKPFSAWYFVGKNRLRCFLLIFMFFLTFIAYIGGLYATNIMAMNDAYAERLDKYAIIYARESWKDFENAIEEIQARGDITALQQGYLPSAAVESIMQFPYGFGVSSFRSVEAFEQYCEYMDITCDTSNLKEGSFIASKLMANNRGVGLGEEIEEGDYDNFNRTYTLDAITDEAFYSAYIIDSLENGSYMLLPTDMPLTEFCEYMDELEERYDVYIYDGEKCREEDYSYLKSFEMIYSMIVVLLAIVMAITMSAAFVGMYQQREPEFAVYRAIGISKGRVVGKIVKELILMDGIGMVLGGAMMLLAIYLSNHLVLIPKGWMLMYYHPTALIGLILCNVTALVPLMLTRSRKLLKVDICEY